MELIERIGLETIDYNSIQAEWEEALGINTRVNNKDKEILSKIESLEKELSELKEMLEK